jgi:hypothetical protein
MLKNENTHSVVLSLSRFAQTSRQQRFGRFVERAAPVCTENLFRVDAVMETPKLAE